MARISGGGQADRPRLLGPGIPTSRVAAGPAMTHRPVRRASAPLRVQSLLPILPSAVDVIGDAGILLKGRVFLLRLFEV
jgi:hypothetical protein